MSLIFFLKIIESKSIMFNLKSIIVLITVSIFSISGAVHASSDGKNKESQSKSKQESSDKNKDQEFSSNENQEEFDNGQNDDSQGQSNGNNNGSSNNGSNGSFGNEHLGLLDDIIPGQFGGNNIDPSDNVLVGEFNSDHDLGNGNFYDYDFHQSPLLVPELNTYAMLLSGLGLLGFFMYRRRK